MELPRWFQIARQEIGVCETTGIKATQRIVEYHSATSLKATSDETPWCSSFVNWCLKQCFIKGTNSAAARSFMQWGHELKEPVQGCIVVLSRGNDEKSGHVGFYSSSNETHIHILGGNQGNKVSVEAFPKSKVLSYRSPFRVLPS
jgi:uncharacterized protein (TIGR02594 family)